MMRLTCRFVVLACAVLALAGTATANEHKGEETMSDTDGKRCLSLTRLDSTKVVDDRTLLFEMKNGDTYVNHLKHRCPGLEFEESFLYETNINQLCSLDTITVLRTMGFGFQRGASCGLNKFQPIDAEEAKALKSAD